MAVGAGQLGEVVSGADRDDAERGAAAHPQQPIGNVVHGAIAADRDDPLHPALGCLGRELRAVKGAVGLSELDRPPLLAELPRDRILGPASGAAAGGRVEDNLGVDQEPPPRRSDPRSGYAQVSLIPGDSIVAPASRAGVSLRPAR